jgi:hypothetical protein
MLKSSCSIADYDVAEKRTTRKVDYLISEKPRKETMVEFTNVEA